jgi:hypothetical protein
MGRSVDDAEEARWWGDAEDKGNGWEWEREDEERMELNWMRNVTACYQWSPVNKIDIGKVQSLTQWSERIA